jgi:hypothetical protein
MPKSTVAPKGGILDYLGWFLAFFSPNFRSLLLGYIHESDALGIYSLDELSQKRPEIRDFALREAKNKLRTVTHGLDKCEQNSATKEFTRFNKGLTLVIPLIETIGAAHFAPQYVADGIIKTFKAAVSSGGFIFYDFHDGEQTLEEFQVKDGGERGIQGIELAYVYLNVNAKKLGGWIYDDSKTTVTYTFKTIKFSNLDSVVRWLYKS